jgi:hypothetical protein
LAEQQARLRDETSALLGATKKFESDSDVRRKALDEREAKLAAQLASLEQSRQEIEHLQAEARVQLEQEKQQVRQAFEALQNERRDFLEQRMSWKPL